jgi:ABC-type nitrate/sulfonate/bicarbonate transport system substrate-binding protein
LQTASAAAFVLGAQRTAFAQSLPGQTIRVGLVPEDDATPVLYAVKQGAFAKAGINVDVQRLTSGSAIAAAVAGGAVDIGKSSLSTLVNAHVKGIPFTIVAPSAIYTDRAPYGQLVVAKDSTIAKASDLDGQTVATSGLNDLGQLGITAWVARNGGDVKSLHVVEIPMSAGAAAVAQHRIVAMMLVEPSLSRAIADGSVRALAAAFGAIAPTFLFSGWFAMADWASAHGQAVRSFANVVMETGAFTNTHHELTAPMLSENTGIPMSVIEHMTRPTAATTIDPTQLQPLIDAGARYGFIPKSFPARELFSPEILRS